MLGTSGVGGAAFAAHMFPAFVASVLCITGLVAVAYGRSLAPGRSGNGDGETLRPGARDGQRFRPGLSSVGVAVAVAAMLLLPAASAAPVVLATGGAVALVAWRRGRVAGAVLRRGVNLPILLGLCSVAVAMGVLGRVWSAPSELVAHAPAWQAAVTGAVASVAVNNLPAAALLGARPVADPSALLVGLDLGPNLFVTGALSAVLWWQVARPLGAPTSVRRFVRLGLVLTPLSMAAALGALAVLG